MNYLQDSPVWFMTKDYHSTAFYTILYIVGHISEMFNSDQCAWDGFHTNLLQQVHVLYSWETSLYISLNLCKWRI